jgi:hypothetical protein|tara:strand:+ start:322 stop:603 length:282 start_codon:yes stop_codon:yes gene_type:complete
MSQSKEIILKLKNLIELRHNTIIANKKSMKSYLVEYKKALELDREIKKEIRSLNEAISLLQYGTIEDKDTEEIFISENIAANRSEVIYTDDEE